MKKVLTSIIVVVLLLTCTLTVLTACQPPVDYEHTIVFYSSQGDALVAKTANAIAAFEAKFPGWKVQHLTQGGYDDVRSKVVSDFQGQQQPDLVYCYADHVAQYIQTGKVVNMMKFIESEDSVAGEEDKQYAVGYTAEEVADFVEGYYLEGYAKNFTGYEEYYDADDMLALPFVKSTEVLYYNNTALKKAGISAPATTWEELWEQAAILKQRFPNAVPLGYDSEANWFITMCEQNGWGYTSVDKNDHYKFNGEKQQEWLEELAGYYDLKYIATQTEYGSYTSALFTAGEETGCIYCVGSSGGASHQNPNGKFDWGVAPIPGSANGVAGKKNAAISQGPSLAILSGGHKVSNVEEKELMTWMFVKELLDPTFQAEFAEASGYNPARISANEDPDYVDFLDGDSIVAATAKVAAQMAEDNLFFTSPAFVGSSTARTQVGNALVAALTGQKSPADALNDAFRFCGGSSN